jgi:hypothetical protein
MRLTERVPQNKRCGAALPLSHRLALTQNHGDNNEGF